MRPRSSVLAAVILASSTLGSAPAGRALEPGLEARSVLASSARPTSAPMLGSMTLSLASIGFPTPTPADFDAGDLAASQVLTVRVRQVFFSTWRLWIRSDDPDMGWPSKPIGDLQYRVGGGGWTSLTGSDVQIASGFWLGNVDVEFRVLLDWASDAPAAYDADVTFELTVP